jgi:glycosyltransferase involved in cell wall biosynthesis
MNILYDGKIFKMQKAGGINRYFAEIISALPADWTPSVMWAKDLGRNAPQHPRLRVSDPFEFRPRRYRHSFNRHFRFKPALQRTDVVHPTYCELSEGIRLIDVTRPMVATAYDFILAKYPHLIAGAVQIVQAQDEMMKRADHVVCISKCTQNDLLERHPSAAGKSSVIHLGTSFEILEGPPTPPSPGVFLFVGMRRGYKNFSFLLRAFADACTKRPELKLKVAGAPFTEDELWEMHFLGLTNRVTNVPYPDEAALNRLYRESLALLYPSIHEGFGIPPLEAMACQTIAVTANTSCLPEIVGNGGILLDPCSETDWTECILQIADGNVDRTQLLKNGTARVKQFSWKKCADEHVALYRSLA